MSVRDVWTRVATHQLEGIMFHGAMVEYFQLMGAYGFEAMQQCQQREELCKYYKTTQYILINYGGLVKTDTEYRPNFIPEEWYSNGYDVNWPSEKWRGYYQSAFNHWLDWEKSTCTFYENAYEEIHSLENTYIHVSDIKSLYNDANNEVEEVKNLIRQLTAVDWDIFKIRDLQKKLYNKYRKKN